jgi:phospholipid/cholesterol/gamma-HCH transport system substrate-binding protein
MGNNTVETIMGAIVVAVAALFVWYTYSTTGSSNLGGYEVVARLPRVDGIATGTDVRLSGIKIGAVREMTLEKNYLVTVHMDIHGDVEIPDDSSLVVTSSGLLGGSYVSISPGGSDAMLKPGGQITNVQGAVDVMSLIGRYIGGGGSGGGQQKPAPAPGVPNDHP